MKHDLLITIMLVSFFVLAQIVGLALISTAAQVTKDVNGNISIIYSDTAVGARPETTGFGSFLYLIVGVAIGTLLVLVLIKYQRTDFWRLWFFLAVWIAMSISIGVLLNQKIFFNYDVALTIGLVLALWKIFKPNIIIHNITEVLMYAGIAVLLAPIFDVMWAIILLLVISAYDIYAVWTSKHMVKMAKFQTQSKVFAGLMIPYKTKPEAKQSVMKTMQKTSSKVSSSKMSNSKTAVKTKTAILGGGDVAFPLIFSGTVMQQLLTSGMSKAQAFMHTSIIVLTTTIALALLFVYAKKDKFYPAMPFITAGCLLGWAIVLII